MKHTLTNNMYFYLRKVLDMVTATPPTAIYEKEVHITKLKKILTDKYYTDDDRDWLNNWATYLRARR